jgi:hypothetical protein
MKMRVLFLCLEQLMTVTMCLNGAMAMAPQPSIHLTRQMENCIYLFERVSLDRDRPVADGSGSDNVS